MKKIIFLALCVVTACFTLVACDDVIGGDLDDYEKRGFGDQEIREEVELDLYIITDDATQAVATKTVNQAIDKYTSDKYKVRLDIHYIKAADYKASVLAGVAATDAKDKADIVLINSKELYDELMAGKYLFPLDYFLDSEKIGNFSLINKNIPKIKKDVPACLWDAISDPHTETVKEVDSAGNKKDVEVTYSCFAVPNNRLIGEYKYLVINRAQFFGASYSENDFNSLSFKAQLFKAKFMAEGIECAEVEEALNYAPEGKICIPLEEPADESDTAIKYFVVSISDLESKNYTEDFMEDDVFFAEVLKEKLLSESIECSIQIGKYSDQETYKAAGNLCIVLEKPTVDADYVFESAFGVVKGTGLEDRAMEIIYAINTEKQLRNLLQYGDVLTHYNVVNGDIVYKDGADSEIYRMNLLYTGNVFTADYCSAIGWDAAARANAEAHNKDAVAYIPEESALPAEPGDGE